MSALEQRTSKFDAAEQTAYEKVREFQTENDDWLAGLKETLDDKFDSLTEALGDQVNDETMDRAYSVVADKLNDGSNWSIDTEDVLEAYRDAGHSVDDLDGISALDLEVIEDVSEGLESNYRMAAAGQGAATGAGGLGAALADLPAIALTGMRAVHEHAAYYGFSMSDEASRTHALLVLAAAATSDSDRGQAVDELLDVGQQLHGVQSDGGDPIPTDEIVEHIVGRLARGTAIQALPMVGSVIGGGLDQAFLKSVCNAARNAYRQRWLLRAHVD